MEENAYTIMARIVKMLKSIDTPQTRIDEYLKEAMSGDYDNLVRVSEKWSEVA